MTPLSCRGFDYIRAPRRDAHTIAAVLIRLPIHTAPAWKLDASGRYMQPRPLRVIVADDERDTVTTLTLLLNEDGHDAIGVHHGAQVLDAVDEFDPDVVLLDIAMPDMSGYEVAKEIRRKYGEVRPLLIAISGRYKKASDRMLAEIVGFDHHVAKPYDPQALLALLKY
jgi:DNA-binding response OmpR family regulator